MSSDKDMLGDGVISVASSNNLTIDAANNGSLHVNYQNEEGWGYGICALEGTVTVLNSNATAIRAGEAVLSGGVIDMTYKDEAIWASKITCPLYLPEGVEIRKVEGGYAYMMDYANASGNSEALRNIRLPGPAPVVPDTVPAANVPATGDSASIALWLFLAAASLLCMASLRKKAFRV